MPKMIHSRRTFEGGQIAVMLALLIPVLVGLAGLVIDGGLMLINYRRGQITVDAAALAAAAQLDEAAFRDQNVVQLNAGAAYAAALQSAQTNGGGRVAITGVSVAAAQVVVSGQVSAPVLFLRIFGVGQVRFSVSASAELKHGITEENQ